MAANTPEVNPITRRSWLRFSLRTLLVATSIAALGAYWLHRRMKAAVEQAEAIQQLQSVGINIHYRHEWDFVKNRFSGSPPPGGKFLRSILGDHFFLTPDLVLKDQYLGDITRLAPLAKLCTVTTVAIYNSPFGDEVVEYLLPLTSLEELNLYGTNLTDAGLLRLVALPQLQNLVVTHTKVTAEGVTQFSKKRPQCKIHTKDDVDDQ